MIVDEMQPFLTGAPTEQGTQNFLAFIGNRLGQLTVDPNQKIGHYRKALALTSDENIRANSLNEIGMVSHKHKLNTEFYNRIINCARWE